MYTKYRTNGYSSHHHSHHQHSCQGCGHPTSQCCCHMTCKHVDRELLVEAEAVPQKPDGTIGLAKLDTRTQKVTQQVLNIMHKADFSDVEAVSAGININNPQSEQINAVPNQFELIRKMVMGSRLPIGADTAVIGGLCCVKLSMEYMPLAPLSKQPSFVGVAVVDSQATIMAWGKLFQNGDHQYKEAIISVNPGAKLTAVAVNAICRIRWCETISC